MRMAATNNRSGDLDEVIHTLIRQYEAGLPGEMQARLGRHVELEYSQLLNRF